MGFSAPPGQGPGFTLVYHRGKSAYVRSCKEQIRLLTLTDALLIIRLLRPTPGRSKSNTAVR